MADPTPIMTALDRAGYRLTEPRRALAALIADQDGHFTAAELVVAARDRRLGIGRATVFRTLDVLAEVGAVERLDLPSGEHAYVGCEPAHHHHVVCSRCGRATGIDDSGLQGDRARGRAPDGLPGRRPPPRAVRPVPGVPGRPTAPDQPQRLTRASRPAECAVRPTARLGLTPLLAVDAGRRRRRGGVRNRAVEVRPGDALGRGHDDRLRRHRPQRRRRARHGQLDHPGRRRPRGLRAETGRREEARRRRPDRLERGRSRWLSRQAGQRGRRRQRDAARPRGRHPDDRRRWRAEPPFLARPEPRREPLRARHRGAR